MPLVLHVLNVTRSAVRFVRSDYLTAGAGIGFAHVTFRAGGPRGDQVDRIE